MCTMCQSLDPKIEEYDSHGLDPLDSPNLGTSFQADAQTSGSGGTAGGKPFYSYDQIADYLTDGYWEDTGREARSFDAQTGDTLTVDLSGLDAEGAKYAKIALDAWTKVSGLKFEEINQSSGQGTPAPTAIIREGADVVANANTTASIEVGQQFSGKIERATEKDWIAVELEAGQKYSITMQGEGGSGKLNDTFLRIRNDNGQSVAQNDDRAAGDRSSAIDFTAGKSGTFYIEASGYGNNTGNYKVNVVEGSSGPGAQITFVDDNSGAYAFSTVRGNTIQSATINIDSAWQSYGTYYLQTYIHEIGHALGLGHAGNYNFSASFSNDAHFANDSWQTSIMSYFDQRQNSNVDADRAFVATPQMADIVAIHNLYGTPTDSNAGNTIYGEDHNTGQWGMALTNGMSMTIHDTGGIDLINLESSTVNQRVNLKDGTFSDINGKDGNIGIAVGTIIENVTTGSGNDVVTGNEADNVMSTGAGNDILKGGAGNDILNGGNGSDTIDGGTGVDTAQYDVGAGNFEIIYDAATLRDGLLKIKDANGNIDKITNVEKLAFSNKTLDVADLIATLQDNHGTIGANSGQSVTVNLGALSVSDGGVIQDPDPDNVVIDPPNPDGTGMEIGNTRIEQLSSSYWQTVTFDQAIEDAAVIMGPASADGAQPLNVRIRNVTDTGFQFQIDEWDYLDGYHVELSISWIAGSVGSHTLADGTRVTFGQEQVSSLESTTVDLDGFDDKPMVLAQLTGDREDTALTTRLDNVDQDSFDFRLQTEEAKRDTVSSIAQEDLYWMAIDIAEGSNIFTNGQTNVDSTSKGIGAQLDANDGFFAGMQTFNGRDTASLRYERGDNDRVSLRVEEEQSLDEEITHIDETVAWFKADEGVFDFV